MDWVVHIDIVERRTVTLEGEGEEGNIMWAFRAVIMDMKVKIHSRGRILLS